ncbi:hypothetical protein AMJ39_07180 [candidate division TA06 bacterium DG_24]|uniref:Putative zinc-finger domain-containing protein n=3 Tax=Bacteria division TA06 TaxID=1156500 RepID=A0A0S8JI85_UNCT6|nr:MAG: hypothetical protein AMJ39_07180 [candidate division TA06 bacterium DG_24]KPK66258.1 MAG: hypothetical protein AMJ82_11945 [candidate division TA06 bacterium SM23_40]KPL09415.1 MAG: hypothetical protein AMJ71_06470 [candidate division TA06 bacterium SM1_40]
MSCENVAHHLHDLLDGELDPVEMRRIQQHLDGCEECRRKVEFERTLKGLIRETMPVRDVPASVRTRVVASLHVADREFRRAFVPRGLRMPPAFSFAATAVLILLVLGTWWLSSRARGPGIAQAALAFHTGFVEGSRTVDLDSSNPEEIARWLSERTGLPIHGEALKRVEMEPCGACTCPKSRFPVGLVMYEMGEHCVVLAVAPEYAIRSLPKGRTEIVEGREIILCFFDGTNLVVWLDEAMSCCLASDLPADDLVAMASAIW